MQLSLLNSQPQNQIEVAGLDSKNGVWIITSANKLYTSPSVFLATGKHNIRAMPRNGGSKNDYIGFKMYWQLKDEQRSQLKNQVKIILFKGGYAGLELVENEIANLFLVVTKSRFTTLGKKWDLLLTSIRQDVPILDECFSDAKPCWGQPLVIYGILMVLFIMKLSVTLKGYIVWVIRWQLFHLFLGWNGDCFTHSNSCR